MKNPDPKRALFRDWITAAAIAVALYGVIDPSPVLASEGEGGWGIWETIGRLFNLALVVGVLIYVLRKPLGQFFEERRLSIRRSLEEAQRGRLEAEARLAEMQQRMNGLDAEMAEIRRKAEQEAAEERRRSLDSAQQEAERIVAMARREAEAQVRAASIQLREEAARLAVELAETKIKSGLSPEIERRLVEKFTRQLGEYSMIVTALARKYARALADTALEQGVQESVARDLQGFVDLTGKSAELDNALRNPAIALDAKMSLLDSLWKHSGTQIQPLCRNLLQLLIANGRLGLSAQIESAYQAEVDERLGVVAAEVATCGELHEPQKRLLADSLQKITGKKVKLSFTRDQDLLGGVVLRIGSTVYDGSIRRQLQSIQARMASDS